MASCIAKLGKPAPLRATSRWVVERTNAWPNAFKKLAWCTERRGLVIRFYVALANAIIIVRRLVREAWKRYRWDTRRLRSEGSFAHLCGVALMPASSGKTTGRHRLNRGGNRQANNALWRIVITRLAWHQPTKDYVARRTQEGLSKKEIIRCLKRYVAREVFHVLVSGCELAEAASQTIEASYWRKL
jgi:hypothetical protein